MIPEALSADTAARRARSASVRRSEFLRGPVPMWWLSRAAALPGKALAVGIALWFRVGVNGDAQVRLSGPLLERVGVGRKASYGALKTLAASGLITVRGGRGRRPVVTVRTAAGWDSDSRSDPV